MHTKKSSYKILRSAGFLIVIGVALLIVGVVAAQSQLPGDPLTTDASNDFRPSWSPDGAKIAFFSNRAGDNDIWTMNADGSDQQQLTSGPADDRHPYWSPDGEWVAFDSDREGKSKDIWVVNTSGGEPLQATSGTSFDNFPAWSPDGEQIAYFGYEGGVLELWVVEVADLLEGGAAGKPRRVTNLLADEEQQQCTYACHAAAWSPDGQQLAYNRANHTEVWVVGVDGSDPHPVGVHEGHMHYPWWTPDGKLLLLSEHNNERSETVNDVWLMDNDGSNPNLLYSGIPHGGPFYWNPNDIDTIAFHSPRSGNFDIYTAKLSEGTSITIESPQAEEVEAEAVEPEDSVTEEVMEEPSAVETEVVVAAEQIGAEVEAESVPPEAASPWSSVIVWIAAIVILLGLLFSMFWLLRGRTS